ncbi:MAG: DMT family transporter [Bacteroidetes bacterium]|nr:DMT family transporter [Bacteroidota bacterium]MBS1633914.1 DMT family transporter [Bacteroidota bacterium]
MNNRFISWIVFILLSFIWGSPFIIMKLSKESLPPLLITSLLIFSAGIVLLPFAVLHIAKIPRRKIGIVIIAGIFGNFLPAFLYPIAISNNIDSALAGILNSLTPIFVIILGLLFFKSRISSVKAIGVFIGFAGMCLLTLMERSIHFQNSEYALLIVLAAISYAVNILLVGHFLKDQNPFHITTVSISFLVIPTAFILWQQNFPALNFHDSGVIWSVIAVALLGITGTAIATGLFYILLKKGGGVFASMIIYGTPFVALFWGFIYHEKITALRIVSLVIILAGVYLASRKGSENNQP